MQKDKLQRKKADVSAKPEYPDLYEIAGDRRRFLRILGGIVLGAAAGLTGSATGLAEYAPPDPPEDIPVPGGKGPSPDLTEIRPGGVAPELKDPEPLEEDPPEPERTDDPKDKLPPDIPRPGEAPPLPTPEYELDGDVAEIPPPTKE